MNHDDITSHISFGRLAFADLPAVAPFARFRAAVREPDGPEVVFRHAPDHEIALPPDGLVRGRTVFGAEAPAPVDAPSGAPPQIWLRGLSSIALNDAILAPRSMAVASPVRGLLDTALDSPAVKQGRLSAVDPDFTEAEPDTWRLLRPVPGIASTILPVGGARSSSYGRFLFEGLCGALLHHETLGPGIGLAGPPLATWQKEIFDLLGLGDAYLALRRPTRFRKIVTTDLNAWTARAPNPLARTIFDRIRAVLPAADGPRRVMLRRGAGNRRLMRERERVEAVAGQFGFSIVDPAMLSAAAQAQLFAGATAVIGETGAGLANLGFCDPETRVLEIQSDRLPDGRARAACHMMGLHWHVFFGVADGEPGMAPGMAPGGGFGYAVDPNAFAATLDRVFGAP
ncbi:MAG TPA: glycosyltransferase family 61 protein [Acidiphilium sp.]|nr:glycosyltransferase family 61 protein [Acidiphilium sp.]